MYRVFEFKWWQRPKLDHSRKALFTHMHIICWWLCIYDLGPDLPIDIFVLYFTLFITMMDCSKTHCSVRVEWVGCGTSAEHTWPWTFDRTSRYCTPALATWCGQTHLYWFLLYHLAVNYGRLPRRNAEISEVPDHITETPEFRLVLFRPELHEFRPKRRNSGDSGVSRRNAETVINSQA